MTGLIRDLVSVDTAFVLVLDDDHLIQAPEIHRAIDFLGGRPTADDAPGRDESR